MINPDRTIEAAGLKALVETLNRCGYLPFYLFFGDGNFRMREWKAAARKLTEPLRSLVRLFLLQMPVRRAAMSRIVGEQTLAQLVNTGILLERGAELASNSFGLLSFRSCLCFCQLNPDPWAYFGRDSAALATYQSYVPGGRVLDLCSGPGIQALLAARSARSVTGVEISRPAWQVALLNQEVNSVGNHLRFVNLSLEEFARRNHQQFDRILFNPPYLPVPEGMACSLVGHGGGDGLAATKSILELYRPALKANGRFEFIGVTLGSGAGPAGYNPLLGLTQKHRLQGTTHILSKHPLRTDSALVNAYAAGLARRNAIEPLKAREVLLKQFRARGDEFFFLFFCSWGKTAKHRAPTPNVIDMSSRRSNYWFV